MTTHYSLTDIVRSTPKGGPCVSIYLNKPNGRLSETTSSIELYRRLNYARGLLENSFSSQTAADYVRPLLQVAKDELMSEDPGSLALFHTGETSICIRLPERTLESTVVADNFHVKPLLKTEQFTLQPGMDKGLGDSLRQCAEALASNQAETDLFRIAQAFRSGGVKRLWVADDIAIWGFLSRKHGSVILHSNQMNERDGDILDDFCEWALDERAELTLAPRHQIPGQHSVVAAISR